MSTCVLIDRETVKAQQLQLVVTGLAERRAGNMETTLNALGVIGSYVQSGGPQRRKYEVYVSAYANVEMVKKYLEREGLYSSSPPIWIDGTIGEDETITDEDRLPDEEG